MTIQIPATGEHVEAHLIEDDPSVPLSLTLGAAGRVIYVLAAVLDGGWRIVGATSNELAILRSHGFTLPLE